MKQNGRYYMGRAEHEQALAAAAATQWAADLHSRTAEVFTDRARLLAEARSAAQKDELMGLAAGHASDDVRSDGLFMHTSRRRPGRVDEKDGF